MTMFSFRVDDKEAEEARRWAERLGVDRSELLRDALHGYLIRLRAEQDIGSWARKPLTAEESSLATISDRGPAEERTGPMRKGEIWFAGAPGGDRPDMVLTRDPAADRIGTVVVAALKEAFRQLVTRLSPGRMHSPVLCSGMRWGVDGRASLLIGRVNRTQGRRWVQLDLGDPAVIRFERSA